MKNIATFFLCALLSPICATGMAQENSPDVKLKFEARADYNHDNLHSDQSGMKGNIIDIKVEGNINDRFAYKYRQRLNKPNKDASFFDGTDWLYLTYKAHKNVSLMAGKWIVALGGWETEPAPIDVFQVSEFCYNYACYQWGASVILNTDDEKNQWYLQMCESPFRTLYREVSGQDREMWAYNILWIGDNGFFHTFYSVNMMECQPGKYMNFVALGNRFDLGQHLTFDIDLQGRATKGKDILKDYTISTCLTYVPCDALRFFAKLSHDANKTGHDGDVTVHDGTELTRLGGGIEYFPLKNDKVRLHAQYSHSWGKNTNPYGMLSPGESIFNMGLTWRMEVLK